MGMKFPVLWSGLGCEMLGDISSYRATLQSEGKQSIHSQCLHKSCRKRNPNEITDYFVCTTNAHAWMSVYTSAYHIEKHKLYNGSEP